MHTNQVLATTLTIGKDEMPYSRKFLPGKNQFYFTYPAHRGCYRLTIPLQMPTVMLLYGIICCNTLARIDRFLIPMFHSRRARRTSIVSMCRDSFNMNYFFSLESCGKIGENVPLVKIPCYRVLQTSVKLNSYPLVGIP